MNRHELERRMKEAVAAGLAVVDEHERRSRRRLALCVLVCVATVVLNVWVTARAFASAGDDPAPAFPPETTTSTAAPPHPTAEGRAVRARLVSTTTAVPVGRDRAGTAARAVPAAGELTVESTAYCLSGVMANGAGVHDGAVAMNGVPFGARWLVLSGPLSGRTLTVADRIGWGSDFDVWMASCDEADLYGRRTITIRRVS